MIAVQFSNWWMLFVIAFIFVLYSLLLLQLRRGVQTVLAQTPSREAQQFRAISVVVAVRNEVANLGGLVNDLKSQNYPHFSYEVILVDDHSTDGSYELLQRLIHHDSRFRLTRLGVGAHGKKSALAEAIRLSKGEIILTTDADCRLPESWCRAMNVQFEAPATRMCMGPVRLQTGTSFFDQLQALEYVSVAAVTIGSVGWGRPTMASGANLAYRKDAFYEVDGYFDEETLASGDDQFLMEKMCARYRSPVVFAADAAALVTTRAQPDVRSFLRQRLRWAGKWGKMQRTTRMLAVGVFLFHLTVFSSPFIAFLVPGGLAVVAGGWVIKAVAEGYLLFPVARFSRVVWSTAALICWQPLYPIYAVAVGAFSRRKKITWKQRTWQNQQ